MGDCSSADRVGDLSYVGRRLGGDAARFHHVCGGGSGDFAGAQVVTMRNVVLAALVILTLTPESLFHAGFQLSFAATMAIIAVYELVSLRGLHRSAFDGAYVLLWRRMSRAVLTLALTSLAAWSATGPLAVIHFNRIAVARR